MTVILDGMTQWRNYSSIRRLSKPPLLVIDGGRNLEVRVKTHRSSSI